MTREAQRLLLGDKPLWQEHAACKDLPTRYTDYLFFNPDQNDPGFTARRRLCSSCPVRWQCLETGNDIDMQFGAWGGLRPEERRLQRRYRGKEVRPEQIRAEYGMV